MSSFRIIAIAVGLSAIVTTSTSAGEVRYAGGPKTGQVIFNAGSLPWPAGGRELGGSSLDARAQLREPQRDMPKGGIASRGL
jgi:hypothetical protein